MFFKKTDYVVISANEHEMKVRIKATNKEIIVKRAIGEVLIDFNNEQYNSDHRFERHQDHFFTSNPKDTNVDPLNEIGDRYSIEVTSTYGNEYLLDSIIAVEDAIERQRLIDQLPDALATLTDRQRYVVTRYYIDRIKKREIAKEMGISAVMVGRHEKAAIAKLQRFYGVIKK